MKIKDLTQGLTAEVNVLLTGIEERITRPKRTCDAGKPYLVLSLSDGEREIQAYLFGTEKVSFAAETGKVLRVRLSAESYNGSLSYKVGSYAQTDEDPAQYVRGIMDIDPQAMFQEIYGNTGFGRFQKVVKAILDVNRDKFLSWSAAKNIHHNVKNGLLYHTYRMMKMAEKSADVYAAVLDCELLIAGTVLHDIGKLRELSFSELAGTDYTPEGVLLGHLLIGAEYVGKMCEQCGVSEKDTMLMKHIIASHHGKLEWGAISVPAIPEAMIVHELDMIDSRIYQFEEVYKTIESNSLTDSKVFGLDTRVYKA